MCNGKGRPIADNDAGCRGGRPGSDEITRVMRHVRGSPGIHEPIATTALIAWSRHGLEGGEKRWVPHRLRLQHRKAAWCSRGSRVAHRPTVGRRRRPGGRLAENRGGQEPAPMGQAWTRRGLLLSMGCSRRSRAALAAIALGGAVGAVSRCCWPLRPPRLHCRERSAEAGAASGYGGKGARRGWGTARQCDGESGVEHTRPMVLDASLLKLEIDVDLGEGWCSQERQVGGNIVKVLIDVGHQCGEEELVGDQDLEIAQLIRESLEAHVVLVNGRVVLVQPKKLLLKKNDALQPVFRKSPVILVHTV